MNGELCSEYSWAKPLSKNEDVLFYDDEED